MLSLLTFFFTSFIIWLRTTYKRMLIKIGWKTDYMISKVSNDYTSFSFHVNQFKLLSKIVAVKTLAFQSGIAFGPADIKIKNICIEGDYIIFSWMPDEFWIDCENGHTYEIRAQRVQRAGRYASDPPVENFSLNDKFIHYTKFVPRYTYPMLYK